MQKWEELAYARLEGKEEGKIEGKIEGKAEGEELLLIRLVCKKMIKGKSPETIAEELEEELSVINGICEAAEKYAPEYGWEKVAEEFHKR